MSDEPAFRIYVLRDDEPHCIASCHEDAIGFTLRTLKDEEQIVDGDCVGVLERHEGWEWGRWLINPWPATPFGVRS